MPPEIAALIDKPWLLAIVLAIGAVSGMAVERIGQRWNRAKRRAYWENKQQGGSNRNAGQFGRQLKSVPPQGTPERAAFDAAGQLRIVMEANFTRRPLLNRPERRVLAHLDRILAEEMPTWRAMGQVSLGEILASNDPEAYFAVNSKRVDLLIVDEDFQPQHVIEFQGTGHHLPGNSAAARDAVKKEALRKAGIGYIEISSGDTPAELRFAVRKMAKKA